MDPTGWYGTNLILHWGGVERSCGSILRDFPKSPLRPRPNPPFPHLLAGLTFPALCSPSTSRSFQYVLVKFILLKQFGLLCYVMKIGMLQDWGTLAHCPISVIHPLIIVLLTVIYTHVPATAVVVVPSSSCYAFDNDSRLIDFTDWVGKNFEYVGKGSEPSDWVVQFCKDVQKRSQAGYIEFGRFISSHSFQTGPKPVDFIQRFHNGDLVNCETSFELMGRTAQVNIICGHCSNQACVDESGCICSVLYDITMCRVFIELAIPCARSGPRVFKSFTVGFYPRSSEVVHNGMTQPGFEKFHHSISFQSEQTHVSLYLSAMSSMSGLIGKPTFKVYPAKGLDVTLTGSGANGVMPTTLSPTVLNVNWICEVAESGTYEVNILIPVEGYDPIEFTLTKECGYKQERESNPIRGWAAFGIISCIFIVSSIIFCCGGFIYKSRVERQYGLGALPGMTILSAFLDAVTVGRPRGYMLGDYLSGTHASHASWGHTPGTTQVAQRTNDSRYGSI